MYDTALLTRCYTQHALPPFIDSESNHIRHFIKTPFIKGTDFIDLPSIFQEKKSVIQSIPTYFQNSEPPIICCKYNKPIRNTILISINLFLILIFILLLFSLETVMIQNIFIDPPDIEYKLAL